MAYTALQLITRAYYLSQVVSRNLQTVSGDQIADGLYLLNALLDIKGSDLRLIPYFNYFEFNTISSQEMYFIPNLLSVDTMTFNIGVVRYPMIDKTRHEYFASARVDNISSLPFSYRVERQLGGANIYLYYLPSGLFQVKLWGKFSLTDVSLTTDLSLTYDPFYIEYLRYAVAEYICCEWGATFPDMCAQKYKEIRKKLMDVQPKDLSLLKSSYFNSRRGLDWQQINIGVGWTP